MKSQTTYFKLLIALACFALVSSSSCLFNPCQSGGICSMPRDLSGDENVEGLATVPLGTAANYVILTKSGISTTGVTAVVGDMAVSPIAATAITGFSLTMDGTGTFSRSPLVTGKVWAATYSSPTPTVLIAAIGDMNIASNNAAGRLNPNATELGGGDISGMTIRAGLYKWTSSVMINTFIDLNGGVNDIFIFQIAGDLKVASTANVYLTGGARAANIFWQVSGQVVLGANSHFEGNTLCATSIAVLTGASVNGRLLAGTAVTLNANSINLPTAYHCACREGFSGVVCENRMF